MREMEKYSDDKLKPSLHPNKLLLRLHRSQQSALSATTQSPPPSQYDQEATRAEQISETSEQGLGEAIDFVPNLSRRRVPYRQCTISTSDRDHATSVPILRRMSTPARFP